MDMDLNGKTAIVTGASSGHRRLDRAEAARGRRSGRRWGTTGRAGRRRRRARGRRHRRGQLARVRRRGGRGARRDRHPLQQRRSRARPRAVLGVDRRGRGGACCTRTSTASCGSPGSASRTPRRRPHRLHGLDRRPPGVPERRLVRRRPSSPFAASSTRCARICSAGRSGSPRSTPVSSRPSSRSSGSSGDAEQADAVYEGIDPITPDEVADCVMFALTRPPHVNIDEIVIKALPSRAAPASSAGHVALTLAAALAVRPRDPPLRAPGARCARRRAALHPRRHRDRRPPRSPAARGARRRRDRAVGARDVQLPPVRHDGAGGACDRRGRGRDGGAARRAGAVALARASGSASPLAVARARRARSSTLFGVEGETADYAVTYLRIVALGLPSAFLALGGQGYLRGIADLRTPLLIVIAGNVLNLVLEVWFVYGLDWGIEGSAWGTAIAQTAMGLAMACRDPAAGRTRERRPAARAGAAPALARQVHLPPHVRADRLVHPRGRRHRAARRRAARRVPDRVPALDLPRARARRDRDRGPDHRRARARRGRPDEAYDASVRMSGSRSPPGAVVHGRAAAARRRAPARLHRRRGRAGAVRAAVDDLRADAAAQRRRVRARRDPDRRQRRAVHRRSRWRWRSSACAAVLARRRCGDWGVRGVWVALRGADPDAAGDDGARFRRRGWLVTGFA